MWFHNRCDYVTAPSHSVFAEPGLARLRRPHCVISNQIDTALFRPVCAGERQALKARFGLTGPTVTYAGRLGPEKIIEVLLQVVALLKGIVDDHNFCRAGNACYLADDGRQGFWRGFFSSLWAGTTKLIVTSSIIPLDSLSSGLRLLEEGLLRIAFVTR
jgi:glycosyltransferase involved in cell wall biosynthesis